jgi:hypothetical protein
MHDVFYDLLTPKDLRPKRFPRANYITQANLNTLEDFKELSSKELEKLVTVIYCLSIFYLITCTWFIEATWFTLFTNILCETFLQFEAVEELYEFYNLASQMIRYSRNTRLMPISNTRQSKRSNVKCTCQLNLLRPSHRSLPLVLYCLHYLLAWPMWLYDSVASMTKYQNESMFTSIACVLIRVHVVPAANHING